MINLLLAVIFDNFSALSLREASEKLEEQAWMERCIKVSGGRLAMRGADEFIASSAPLTVRYPPLTLLRLSLPPAFTHLLHSILCRCTTRTHPAPARPCSPPF